MSFFVVLPEPTLEPTPKPSLKKRGVLFLSPEDMQEAKKSMKEKGINARDVKNLPPIEEIHCLDNLTRVVKVNSLYRFDEGDIPRNKSTSQCLDEFDNFIVKQENFNAYVGRQLKDNAYMIEDTWEIICLELKVILSSLVNMLLWLPLK